MKVGRGREGKNEGRQRNAKGIDRKGRCGQRGTEKRKGEVRRQEKEDFQRNDEKVKALRVVKEKELLRTICDDTENEWGENEEYNHRGTGNVRKHK